MAGGFTLNANTNQFEKDIISAADRDLEITFIGHASLMFRYDGKIIHIDPYSRLADYSRLPEADYVLLTHHHSDYSYRDLR